MEPLAKGTQTVLIPPYGKDSTATTLSTRIEMTMTTSLFSLLKGTCVTRANIVTDSHFVYR